MPQVFESLNPIPPVIETTGAELTSLASRAQKRQQEILQNNPLSGATNPAPINGAPGTLPNLFGNPLAQPQGLPGVTNVNAGTGVRTAPSNESSTSGADVLPQGPPTAAPTSLESRPRDTAYTDLTPTQRNSALRARGVKVGEWARDPSTGEAHRTESGAFVLSVEANGRDRMFLAEDGIGAHSAMFQIADQLGLGAVPQDSTRDLGYTVAWTVSPDQEGQFLTALNQLKPSNVVVENGRIHVTFDAHHGLNQTFMDAPFGASKPLSDRGRT